MGLLLKHRGAILLLMINLFINFVGVGIIVPVMPGYMNLLGVSGTMYGLLVAFFSICQLLCSPFAGILSDRFGRKAAIVAGMLVYSLGQWMQGSADSIAQLFFARMLSGLSAALVFPSVLAYTADATTDEERGKGMGYVNAAMTTGFIIGPGIGGFIAEWGIRMPFYTASAAGLIASLITFLLLPEMRRPAKPANGGRAVGETVDANAPGSRFRQLPGALRIWREPYFMLFVLVFLSSFGLASYELIFGLFVDRKLGFGTREIATILTIGSIGGAIVQLSVFGWLVNRFGEIRLITITLAIAAVFSFLTVFAGQFWQMAAIALVLFLAVDIFRPAVSTRISRYGQGRQGYFAGLYSSFTSLGNMIGPVVGGALLDVHLNAPYTFSAVLLLAGFILSLGTRRWLSALDRKMSVSEVAAGLAGKVAADGEADAEATGAADGKADGAADGMRKDSRA